MSHSLGGSQKARDTLGYLRSQIVGGQWPVGELIPKEPELMELVGVGKSTIREAVRACNPRHAEDGTRCGHVCAGAHAGEFPAH